MLKFRSLVFAGLTLLLLAAACHKNDKDVSSENIDKYKDTIVLATSAPLYSPDLLATFNALTVAFAYNLNTWLYRVPPGGGVRVEPQLADGWPTIANDTEYTIKIKRGFTFADGTPVDAHAVVASIDRIRKNVETDLSLYTDSIESISAVDDYTVRIVIKAKDGRFSSILSSSAYAITNSSAFPQDKLLCTPFEGADACSDQAKVINIAAPNYDVTKLLGAGPYRIDSLGLNSDKLPEMHLSVNPNFPGATSKNKSIIVRSYSGVTGASAAIAEALKNKQVDVVMTNSLKSQEITSFMTDPERTVIKAGGLWIIYLAFRNNAPPFDNVNCRLGIAAAIDRQRIVNQVYPNQAKEATSLIPEGMWGRKEMFGPRDLTLAKKYIEQCYSESKSSSPEFWTADGHLKMEIYGETGISPYLKSAIEETGVVEVTTKPGTGKEWITNVYSACEPAQPMMAFAWGWIPDYFDPDNCLSNYITGDLATCFADPEIEGLISKAQTESDVAIRTKLYEQIQDLWGKKAPVIPLITRFDLPVAQKGCTMSFSMDGNIDFSSIECER